jgi:hypothetical protein
MDKSATMAGKIHVPFEIDPKSIIRTTLEILSGKYYMPLKTSIRRSKKKQVNNGKSMDM